MSPQPLLAIAKCLLESRVSPQEDWSRWQKSQSKSSGKFKEMDPLSRQGTKEMHTTISRAETIGRNQAKDGNLSVRGEFSLIKCTG